MKNRVLAPVLCAAALTLFQAAPAVALEEVGPGIYRIDGNTMDDLLALGSHAHVKVLVLENNKITFTRNDADMIEFSKTSKSGFAKPEVWTKRGKVIGQHYNSQKQSSDG